MTKKFFDVGELTITTANSPPTSISPPITGEPSPGMVDRGGSPPSNQVGQSDVQLVTPTSGSGRSIVSSPFAVTSREYHFSHIHSQPGQVHYSFSPAHDFNPSNY